MNRTILSICGILLLASSLMAAFTWDQTQNISNSYGPSTEPDICNAGDTYFMVWNQWGDIKCKKSTNAGANWGDEILVYSAFDYGGNYPVIAVQGDFVYIFYYRNTMSNSEIFMVRSVNGGQTFESEVQISSAIHGCIVPQVAVTDDAVYVVYEDRDANWDYNIYLQKSTDNGTSWSTPQNISNTDQNARWCTIDASDDNLAVIWNQQTGSSYNHLDLFCSSSADAGTSWSTPQNITNNQAYNARLSTRIIGQHIYTATSAKIDGQQSDIMLYHSSDLGATWDDGINVSDNTGDSSRPDLRIVPTDTTPRIYLTWSDATYFNNDRAQVSASYDGGATWTDFESISQDQEDASWAHMLVQAGDASDTCYVIWVNYLPGTFDSEVWGRHGENALVDFAHISGTVTASNGNPIAGATVTAGNYYAHTAADGSYSIDVLAGTYDVTATAATYQISTVFGVELVANQTEIIDFTLSPQVAGTYPPFNLQGQISGLCDVNLQWEAPLGNNAMELSYDDGIAESFNWAGSATGQEYVATAFSYNENFYLRRIKAMYQSDAAQNIMISVLGDNGGVPDLNYLLAGPVAIPVENTQGMEQWLQHDLDLPLAAGTTFYIAIGWDAGTSFVIGADETQPDGFSYSTNDNGTQWYNLDDRDFIIRAGIDVEATTRDITAIHVYRDNALLQALPYPAFSYTDTTSSCDQSYTYHATSVDADGNESGPSNAVTIAIPAPVLFPPLNLAATAGNQGVDLSWDAPGSQGEWIHWDDGVNANNVGGASITMFDVAIRFDTNDLAAYDQQYLTKMTFWLVDADCEIFARVWSGGSQFYAGTLIAEQQVTDLQANALNEVIFDAPIAIDAQQELWIGYRVINDAGCYPAGCDAGPAVPYKGDMLLYGGDWVSTSTYFGWELNWNIRGFVVSASDLDAIPGIPAALQDLPIAAQSGLPDLRRGTEQVRYDRAFTHYNLYRNEDFLTEIAATELSYNDPAPVAGTNSYYLTSAYDVFESAPSNTASIDVTDATVAPPSVLSSLDGNYPNPFNPSTSINLQISAEDAGKPVTVEVYNTRGQHVVTLAQQPLQSGSHSIIWDGTDSLAQPVSSGIYFYRMRVGSYTASRKMILMK
jgi:hypothetical protein